MKTLLSFITLALLVLFLGGSFSQELYSFDWNSPRVNINGHPHFKVNYYPGTTNSNYKGDFYPDLESNTITKKYTFSKNITLTLSTNYATAGTFTTSLNTTDNPFGSITDFNSILIVPYGITVTFSGQVDLIPALIIKGRVVLDPSVQNSRYWVMKTIIFPTGVLESIPISSSNHTIYNHGSYGTPFSWDPLFTSSFICLGGTVNLKGYNGESMWAGRNSSYTSYGGAFLRTPFSYNTANAPIFRMSSSVKDSYNCPIYVINNYYTKYIKVSNENSFIADTVNFNGAGYLLANPWNKNLWITGGMNSSMVFTLNSTVNIQNCVFYDIGHTRGDVLDDNTLDSSYNLLHAGNNLPDRYPITLLHNKNQVTISNNFFQHGFSSSITVASIPRSFIGAKRSFGLITGNAFALKSNIGGISLLHGTEQFNISFNAFLSVYTDTTTISSYRAYPDIDYLNGGIVTTSPFSTYEGNAFEGNFKGGAFQVIPIQSRSSVTGLSSDILIGTYAGLIQDNTVDYKTNNVWNNVVYKNHFFAGEAEFRFRYSLTSQPTIKVNINFGWHINQRFSQRLGSNQANIELSYDSPYMASTLNVNDVGNIVTSSTHNGKYSAVSIINAIATSTYAYFSESFTSNYLSIKDSKFSHYSASPSTFLKNYGTQLYLSNVNGTKLNVDYDTLAYNFKPLYNLSPISGDISSNKINVSFIPNFDFAYSDGQTVDYIVDDTVQSSFNLYSSSFPNKTMKYNEVQFPKANGVYSVLISSTQNLFIPSVFSPVGPYFANSYTIDTSAINFYLGVDLTSDVSSPATSLSIFGNSWTKCGWVSGICKTTGVFNKVSPTPSTVTESITGTVSSIPNEVSMLTSYLTNDVTLGIKSSVNLTLPPSSSYRFFIYSYNADYTGADIVTSLPLFTIKIAGKYQEPYSRPSSTYQHYKKFGPFFWNSDATDTTLIIEWASNNLKYSIPICGIEIFSNSSSAFINPTSTSSGGAVETSSKSTSATNSDQVLSAAPSFLLTKTSLIN
ncbi:hypothetical protein ACTA71_010629 [Dictyostelium dimigraforme]